MPDNNWSNTKEKSRMDDSEDNDSSSSKDGNFPEHSCFELEPISPDMRLHETDDVNGWPADAVEEERPIKQFKYETPVAKTRKDRRKLLPEESNYNLDPIILEANRLSPADLDEPASDKAEDNDQQQALNKPKPMRPMRTTEVEQSPDPGVNGSKPPTPPSPLRVLQSGMHRKMQTKPPKPSSVDEGRSHYSNRFPEETLDNPTYEPKHEKNRVAGFPEQTQDSPPYQPAADRRSPERFPEETQDNPPFQHRMGERFPDETQDTPPYCPGAERGAVDRFPDETQENPPYQHGAERQNVRRFPENTQDVEPYEPRTDLSGDDVRDYQSRTFPPRHGLSRFVQPGWSTNESIEQRPSQSQNNESQNSESDNTHYHQSDEEFQLGESIYELEPMTPDQLLCLSVTQVEEAERLENERRSWSEQGESRQYLQTNEQVLRAPAPAPAPVETAQEDQFVDYVLANKYQILSKVGVGATAKVYKARQLATGRVVAIKVLKDSCPQNMVEGFEQEIVTHSKLDHKNIVEFIERMVNPAGDVFLVMENIRGISLQEIIRVHGPILKEDYIWNIVSQMCDALEHAHRRGIIHRDLKSANVILAKQDKEEMVVKILDFGLAIREWVSQSVSQGFTAGSPLFMSPEQCRGQELTPRSDLYSLGIIVYEMLTGSTPFTGKNFSEVMASHCNPSITAAPLASAVPDLKGANQLDQIMGKLLKVREGERFQSAAKLREAFAYWYESVKNDNCEDLIPEELFREQSNTYNFAAPQSSLATTVLLRNLGESSDDASRANRPRLNKEKLIHKQAYKSAVKHIVVLVLLMVATLGLVAFFYFKDKGKSAKVPPGHAAQNAVKMPPGKPPANAGKTPPGKAPQTAGKTVPGKTPAHPGQSPRSTPARSGSGKAH